jgi:hypothetical protein
LADRAYGVWDLSGALGLLMRRIGCARMNHMPSGPEKLFPDALADKPNFLCFLFFVPQAG